MGSFVLRGKDLRERERGSRLRLGLGVAKMLFIQKTRNLYANSRCSEWSLAAASGAHEAIQFKFLLQRVASRFWRFFKFSLQRNFSSLQQVASRYLTILHFHCIEYAFSLQRVAFGSPFLKKISNFFTMFYHFFFCWGTSLQ